MNHPEANLQTKIKQWVLYHVQQPHFFEAVDRGKPAGKQTHLWQKRRGQIAGTPDVRLIVPGLPIITIELKAPGKYPTEQQRRVGAAIQQAGAVWGWASSVAGFAALLEKAGVPLQGRWELTAVHYDAMLIAAAIRTTERKTGRPAKARFGGAPPQSKLKRIAKLRAQGIEP